MPGNRPELPSLWLLQWEWKSIWSECEMGLPCAIALITFSVPSNFRFLQLNLVLSMGLVFQRVSQSVLGFPSVPTLQRGSLIMRLSFLQRCTIILLFLCACQFTDEFQEDSLLSLYSISSLILGKRFSLVFCPSLRGKILLMIWPCNGFLTLL